MSNKYNEIGRVGQKRTGGIFYEEFLYELRGKKGIETYREMAENDDVIGSILFAVEMLIRGCSWDTQPGGDSEADEEAATFLWECMNDMTETWVDTISEILSMLTYGWSAHEIVYKRRMGRKKDARLCSKYDDGLIGWQKLPIRAQDTLYRWEYDNDDNLTGMTQMPPPDFGIITIPAEKLLLFRTKSSKGNPEGRSILRNCYRSWYFKKRIQEIEGIGIERDLAGLPVMSAPEDMDIWDDEDADMIKARMEAERYVKNIRRDSMEGVVKPAGWTLELLTSGGKRNFDTNTVIERYDTRIAMTVLADFIMLGHQSTGTYSLGTDKTQLFSVAIGAYLDIIAEVFNNKAVPNLIDMNGEHFKNITDYPKIIHGEIENRNLTELGDFIQKAAGTGVITPDEQLEDYLRDAAKLPERLDYTRNSGMTSPQDSETFEKSAKHDDELTELMKDVKNLLKDFTSGSDERIIKYSEDQPRDENGRWTDGGGSKKNNSKTKYAPSPQRQVKGIQVSAKKYAKLTGIMNTQYPNLKPEDGEKTILDANCVYSITADGYGGMIIHSRIRIK